MNQEKHEHKVIGLLVIILHYGLIMEEFHEVTP